MYSLSDLDDRSTIRQATYARYILLPDIAITHNGGLTKEIYEWQSSV